MNKPISDQKLKEIMGRLPMVRSAKTEKIMEDLPAFMELINDKSKWRKLWAWIFRSCLMVIVVFNFV